MMLTRLCTGAHAGRRAGAHGRVCLLRTPGRPSTPAPAIRSATRFTVPHSGSADPLRNPISGSAYPFRNPIHGSALSDSAPTEPPGYAVMAKTQLLSSHSKKSEVRLRLTTTSSSVRGVSCSLRRVPMWRDMLSMASIETM